MKKTLIIMFTIFLIILVITGYYAYNFVTSENLAKKNNKMYEDVYRQESILGTTLISIINKAMDTNVRNGVPKKENSIYYEDNQENSIAITVKFLEKDESVQMEAIAEKESEAFVKYFATATFKCTKIDYHPKTNYVKSLYFEQI